jgi:hypothetical protein
VIMAHGEIVEQVRDIVNTGRSRGR